MPKPTHTTPADTSEAVDRFIAAMPEPQKAATALLREVLLGSDPRITEGIKWNAPSYKTHEYFATTHLRRPSGIGLVLHLGAKARASSLGRDTIQDPAGLLQWLAQDRAMIEFKDVDDLQGRREDVAAIVRQWVEHV